MRSLPLASVLLACGLSVACAKTSSTASSGDPPASASTAAPVETHPRLTRVADRSLVCMVNNAYMGKAQIPVEVDGKTYFGCCEMCKQRLAREPGTRTANDPLTGETVDKAVAVIATDPEGTVLYFASDDNLTRFETTSR